MKAKKATTTKYARPATFPKTGAMLRAKREEKGFSLRQLAKATSISYETVRLVEGGRSGFGAFRKVLAKGTKVLKLTRPVKLELMKSYLHEEMGRLRLGSAARS